MAYPDGQMKSDFFLEIIVVRLFNAYVGGGCNYQLSITIILLTAQVVFLLMILPDEFDTIQLQWNSNAKVTDDYNGVGRLGQDFSWT